jgi:hypothetical protein
MRFEEATFELGSDVQTRQSRRDRIVSRKNEGHQDVVRGTLKLQIKAVDYGGAPIYVVSEGELSVFIELVQLNTHLLLVKTHKPIFYLLLMEAKKVCCMVERIFLLHAVSASPSYNGSASYNELNSLDRYADKSCVVLIRLKHLPY